MEKLHKLKLISQKLVFIVIKLEIKLNKLFKELLDNYVMTAKKKET